MELLQQLISVLKSFPRDDNEVSRLLQNALRDSSLRDFHPQLIAVSRLSSQTPDISLATRSPKPSPCPPRNAQDDYSSEQQQHEGSNSLFLSCSVLPARISSLSGMQHSKDALFEAIVYPRLYPHLFLSVDPWKRILLFGPPGTGKSTLVRAVVQHAFARTPGAMFGEITASDVLSSFFGESETRVRALFKEALSSCAPTVIYLDEIDSFARTKHASEDDTTRRVKNELLRGLECVQECNHVVVVASTNVPWELDTAVIRRFERRICVSLPSAPTRLCMFRSRLKVLGEETDLTEAVARTENYSGADIENVCRMAAMIPVREILSKIGAMATEEDNMNARPRPVELHDVMSAISQIRPSVNASTVEMHKGWAQLFGESTTE